MKRLIRPRCAARPLALGLALLLPAAAGAVPVAKAGRAFLAYPGETIQLDGRDSEGEAIEYRWAQVGGPDVPLIDGASAQPRFSVELPGRYSFELVVREGDVASEPDVVDVIAIDADVAGRFAKGGCATVGGAPRASLLGIGLLGAILTRLRPRRR
jgi:hypothetical protein